MICQKNVTGNTGHTGTDDVNKVGNVQDVDRNKFEYECYMQIEMG